jgi:hypothetical protein
MQQTYDEDHTTPENLESPIIDGCSIVANLHGLCKFREAAEQLSYDTGDDIFKYFRHIL